VKLKTFFTLPSWLRLAPLQVVVIGATYVLLMGAVVLATAAWFKNPDFDRTSVALSLWGAVTGLVLSRWVASRERRKELLRALAHKLYVALSRECQIFCV